ncbi:MAG: ribosome maturation factor RimP [Clostridia bacterium]
MSKNKVELTVQDISLPILEKLNYEFVDVEFKKEGSHWVLRIYIDKDGGITLDDCQKASEEISERLDELDPIQQSYLLEISSPGIDRPLTREKDFKKAKGSLVEIRLYNQREGKKTFQGELLGLVGNEIRALIEGKETAFNREEVALVKPVIKF